jgi:PKD repeat protein
VNPTFSFPDNGIYSVAVRVTDDDEATGTATATVTVENVAPSVGAITAPMAPVPVGTEINASGPFTDPGVLDTHTAEWAWGDGTTSEGAVTETDGSGSASGSHAYTDPGVYMLTLTVTDKDGDSHQASYGYVVVYDPSAGFVTGGGWIMSPAGAYAADPLLAGKATFGFVAKYKKGATVPDGNTEFQFKAGSLNFKSTAYEWLVIAGAKAQYKGFGTINGVGGYRFMLTAWDGQVTGGGGVDKFRIRIWDAATEAVIYDNQMDGIDTADPTTALGGGSIVIHK